MDYNAVQLAYAKWRLAHPGLDPDEEGFDPNQLELDIDEAIERHPASIVNIHNEAL